MCVGGAKETEEGKRMSLGRRQTSCAEHVRESVPVRRGLYRSPEGVLFQRWLNLVLSSLSVVSSLSSIFRD